MRADEKGEGDRDDGHLLTGARVANHLADAVPQGPEAIIEAARRFTDEEVLLGIAFLSGILEVAAVSARTLARVQLERRARRVSVEGWN